MDISILRKLVLRAVEECQSTEIDTLAVESKEKHVLLPCSLIWAASRRCHPHVGWVFLLQIIWSQVSSAACVSANSGYSKVDNQD